jgi:hypothetical protein
MIDHKAVLRALAEKDGCQASLKAAAHIEYLEGRIEKAINYEETLRRKLARTRHQRDKLRLGFNEDTGADEALRTMREHRDI